MLSSGSCRKMPADGGASVPHAALQPDLAVLLRRRGEELRGRHVAKVTAAS